MQRPRQADPLHLTEGFATPAAGAASISAMLSVSGWQCEGETLLGKLVADELEALVLRYRNGSGVGLALDLARRVLRVSLHQGLDRVVDEHQDPGVFGEVVHKYVVTLLRVLPQVEHLRNGGDIALGAFPAQIRIHRQSARFDAVIAAQIEYGFVVIDARGAGGELILGEVEPGVSRRLAGAEQHRCHIEAVENDRLPLAIVARQRRSTDSGERGHIVQTTDDLGILDIWLDLGTPGDGRYADTAFADRAFGAAERRISRVRVNVLPGTVVGGPKHIGVLVEAERTDLVHNAADAR